MKIKNINSRQLMTKETGDAFFIKPEKEFKIRKRFFQMHRNITNQDTFSMQQKKQEFVSQPVQTSEAVIQDKCMIQLPDTNYQQFFQFPAAYQTKLSFSRSISQLKWHDDGFKCKIKQSELLQIPIKQKIDSNVKNMISKHPPNSNYQTNQSQWKSLLPKEANSEVIRVSKMISTLYDTYPVINSIEQKAPESLPFIPPNMVRDPIKIDPRFIQIYSNKTQPQLPNVKFSALYMSKSKFPEIDSLQQTKSKLKQNETPPNLIDKNDLKYLNSDESSVMPFTTLKDYLELQNQQRVDNQEGDDKYEDDSDLGV